MKLTIDVRLPTDQFSSLLTVLVATLKGIHTMSAQLDALQAQTTDLAAAVAESEVNSDALFAALVAAQALVSSLQAQVADLQANAVDPAALQPIVDQLAAADDQLRAATARDVAPV